MILTSFNASKEACLPVGLQHYPTHDLSGDPFTIFFDVLVDLYGLSARDNPITALKDEFGRFCEGITAGDVRDEMARIAHSREAEAAARAIRQRAMLEAFRQEEERKVRERRMVGAVARAAPAAAGERRITPPSGGDEARLLRLRTHNEDRPKVTVLGGGISGILSALHLALLKDDSEAPVFDVHVVEASPVIMDGASKLICRLHLGNEYPTHLETALHCLLGATLFCQQFQTREVFTDQRFLDFLIARASIASGALTPDGLTRHNEVLKERYRRYLEQIRGVYRERAEELLFGPVDAFYVPLAELVSEHFGFGIRTNERGLQPVGLGVVLGRLLERVARTSRNLHVHLATEVRNIRQMPGGGFELTVSSSRPFYTRYLVNAAWHNISTLNRLAKASPGRPIPSAQTQVYLRTLALVDTRRCGFAADDNSYFGLLGTEGGMVSRFPGVAVLFVPGGDGDAVSLSYQGRCTLRDDVAGESALPPELKARYEELNSLAASQSLGESILGTDAEGDKGARRKYPSLKDATVITSVTRTTLAQSEDLSQRTHLPVSWVEGAEGCMQVASAKGTFAPFCALQTVALFVRDTPAGSRRVRLSDPARGFLTGLLGDGMTEQGLLPEEFVLVPSGEEIDAADCRVARRRYALHHGLPFSMFEADSDATTPDAQVRVIEWGDTVDLEHHPLAPPIAEAVIEVLPGLRGTVRTVKLGPPRIDADTAKRLQQTLAGLEELKTLVLDGGWNLDTFDLRVIMPRLEEFSATSARFDFASLRATIFERPVALTLRKLVLARCYLRDHTLRELFKILTTIPTLEALDLSSNAIGSSLPDSERCIAGLISGLPRIVRLSLRDNGLFTSVKVPDDISRRYEVLGEPSVRVILESVERKSSLRFVDLSLNGSVSEAVQDAFDLYFASA